MDTKLSRQSIIDYFDNGEGDETAFVESLAERVGAYLQDDEKSQLWCLEPDSLRMLILATDEQVVDAFLDQFGGRPAAPENET